MVGFGQMRGELMAVNEGCGMVSAELEHQQTVGRDFLFWEVQQRRQRQRLFIQTSQLDVTLQGGAEALVGG